MDTHERDARRRERRLLDAQVQEQRRRWTAARRLATSEERRWFADFVRALEQSQRQLAGDWRWN
jgi:hypothetical protein